MWPKLKQRWIENQAGAKKAALVTVLLGLILWRLPIGEGFVHWSFDLLTIFGARRVPQDVLLIQLDEPSLTDLRQSFKDFNRTNHANLLNKLTAAQARLVVFDIYFPEAESRTNEDGAFAAALKASGRVVLASVYSRLAGYPVDIASPPLDLFRANARAWGVSHVTMDTDLAVRWHEAETENRPSLAWAAAEAVGAAVAKTPEIRFTERWVRYYGNEGTLPRRSYYVALSLPPEVFRDKIIFIGGKPSTQPLSAQADVFATPYTHWGGPAMSGMEIQATSFLNLLHHEWLTRVPAWAEFLLLLICGVVLGCGLCLLRPMAGLGVWAGAIMVVAAVACGLCRYEGYWFSWMLLAGAQAPCAWACGVVWQTQKLSREKSLLAEQLAGASRTPVLAGRLPVGNLPPGTSFPQGGEAKPGTRVLPVIADHILLRRIGKGAYGEVYIARNAIGNYVAVKVIYREDFTLAEPYDREFRGIQKYMPVSLTHLGLVHLLHVGRNDEAGYFYCVMELGDDEVNPKIEPETYAARNLAEEFKRRGALPVTECVEMFLALTDARAYLHGQGLIHRDIKPSNIIFVKGVPKFADVGLITDMAGTGQEASYVGTEGYIPPEGPGQAPAEVYSLGIVAYQAVTGLDRRRFPELPDTLTQRPDLPHLIELNRIVLKACQAEVAQRYQTAAEMHDALLALREQMRAPV